MKVRVLAVTIALILSAFLAWYFLTLAEAPSAGEENIGLGLGQVAPNFTLTDIDGKTFSLKEYRGKVVVIDLMATWCGPCIAEMSHLKELYVKYDARGVVIMSIDVDPSEGDEAIRQFKAKHGGGWIFASGPSVGKTYDVVYIPTIYIIEKRGRVAYKKEGLTPYSTLASEIDKLL